MSQAFEAPGFANPRGSGRKGHDDCRGQHQCVNDLGGKRMHGFKRTSKVNEIRFRSLKLLVRSSPVVVSPHLRANAWEIGFDRQTLLLIDCVSLGKDPQFLVTKR
jgi:hypothetical protein